MNTINCIQHAIDFIEDNILENVSIDIIASQAYMSKFHFLRIFAVLCNVSPGEYIRNRRLAMAGLEISSTDSKIIDIAFKYGYESPESFSRAFSHFHGIAPTAARDKNVHLNSYPKLSVETILGGRKNMNNLQERGYTVKENGPVYYTNNMDRTAKWFEDTLGWYVNIDNRDSDMNGLYGCALPIPGELVNMKIASFNGIHLFRGEPSTQTVSFMNISSVDALRSFVLKRNWTKVSEISVQPWGAKECDVTTIDGSVMRFFELTE